MLVFPPATPFTYHVTIVVVVEVEELVTATCAVNSACSLICTVAAAGEIVTAVTVPTAGPPQEEIPSNPASATGSNHIPQIPLRIHHPFRLARAASRPTASFIVQEFLVCCLVICLGPLILVRRSRTHTWFPRFPSRKKKFQFLEVSTQDSVARQLLFPRAPHPVRTAQHLTSIESVIPPAIAAPQRCPRSRLTRVPLLFCSSSLLRQRRIPVKCFQQHHSSHGRCRNTQKRANQKILRELFAFELRVSRNRLRRQN